MSLVINGTSISDIGPTSKVIANGTQITNVYSNGSLVWSFDYFYATWSGDLIGGNYPTTAEMGMDTSGQLYRAVIQATTDSAPIYGTWCSVSTTGSLGYVESIATAGNGAKFKLRPWGNTLSWSFYNTAVWLDAVGSCSFDPRGGGFSGSAYLEADPTAGFFTNVGGELRMSVNGTSSGYGTLT